ncbi:MAG: TIGR04086 family membrane protein [Bacillota bacterium]|jgi:putative membrane protein (TIGR04086 family)|nr:TIGR04086 family membrane protein [Bacillota bacterium]HHT91510.1 TIGR04086 family membrane protein [Bacillota bacterium]
MANKNNREIDGYSLRPIAILKGFVLSQFLLLCVSVALALAVYFSSWQASPRLLNVLAHVAVFGGASWAGMCCHRKAWLHGVAVGILAFLVLSWIGYGERFFTTWLWWKAFLQMGLVAMFGGVFGGLFVH